MQRSSIRHRLTSAFAAAAAVIVLLTAATIRLQFAAVDHAAQLEARNLARSVAYGVAVGRQPLQAYIDGLDNLYRRDLVVVDRDQTGLAGTAYTPVAQNYQHDADDEVGQTILDGQPRTFIDSSAGRSAGARQVVVPVYAEGRVGKPIVGAVVLEYTDIYTELQRAAVWQIYAVGAAGLLCIMLVAAFGARVSSSISRRIERLLGGVRQLSGGDYEVRVPIGVASESDEISALTSAFNAMAEELRLGRTELLHRIEDAKSATAEIERLAYHDTLTGLPNRQRFSQAFAAALAQASAAGQPLGLFFVDLDNFKAVNDALGHSAGDEMLKAVAERLAGCLQAGDLLARLGGDEFVVVLPQRDRCMLKEIAQHMLTVVARPMTIQRSELRVSASIGISMYPDDGHDEHALATRADIAVYQAKDAGRNACAFYDPRLNRNSVERLAFEFSLRAALERQQFEVHYQPKLEAATGEIIGAEALLRWRHPDFGNVPPSQFIPVAEATGLIAPIGRWVLGEACRQQVEWVRAGLPPLQIAVNLSGRQFADEGLLADIRRVVHESGIEPACLELEITESILMSDPAGAKRTLAAIRELGLKLALDDFGTGYSSLATLKEFPINALKIDRSFVRNLPHSEDDKAIATAIVSMGKTLGLTIVAEGVETAAQAAFIREQGCDQIQGYFYGKPVPADELARVLARARPEADGTVASPGAVTVAPAGASMASSMVALPDASTVEVAEPIVLPERVAWSGA